VIVKTSTPCPDAVSRSDEDLIASIASSIASSVVRFGLYILSSSPSI